MPCSQTDLSCRSIRSVAVGVTARPPSSRNTMGQDAGSLPHPHGGGGGTFRRFACRLHGRTRRRSRSQLGRTVTIGPLDRGPSASRCFPRDGSAWRVGLCSGGARHRRTARHFPQETAGHGEGSRPSQGARLVLVRKADVPVDLPSANATKGRTGPCQNQHCLASTGFSRLPSNRRTRPRWSREGLCRWYRRWFRRRVPRRTDNRVDRIRRYG